MVKSSESLLTLRKQILFFPLPLISRKVLLSLQVLLSCPDEKDFLNIEAADLWQKDPEAAKKKAREWTQIYARK